MSDYTAAEYLNRWRGIKSDSAKLVGPAVLDRIAMIEAIEPGFTESLLDELGPDGWVPVAFDPDLWLRPKQLAVLRAPVRIKFMCAGRRLGKTQVGSTWIEERVEMGARELVMIGPTEEEIRQYMLGGNKRRSDGFANGSGVLDLIPPWLPFTYKKDEMEIHFNGGAVCRTYSAINKEYRGPGPDSALCDEPIKWRHPEALLSNVRIACSATGKVTSEILITCSPKKLKFMRDLAMDPDVYTVHGKSEENRGNVDEAWYRGESRRLIGTDQGDEELEGELGIDDGGSLFPMSLFDEHRCLDDAPLLDRVVVAVDPNASQHERADKVGICAMGRAGDINEGHAYVLVDKSGSYSWSQWAEVAVGLALEVGASAIVVERDKFGDAPTANLRVVASNMGFSAQPRPNTKHQIDLVHRTSGRRLAVIEVLARSLGDKETRAQPVSTMLQKGRLHIVGHLTQLETESNEWDPKTSRSPNAMDAMVYAAIELFNLLGAPEPNQAGQMVAAAAANARMAETATSRGSQRFAWGGDRRGSGRRL